jgi:hypothetical protein
MTFFYQRCGGQDYNSGSARTFLNSILPEFGTQILGVNVCETLCQCTTITAFLPLKCRAGE